MESWCTWVLCVLLVCSCNISDASIQRSFVIEASAPPGDSYLHLDPKYDRMDEVSKACAPLLSSAAKLRLTKGEKRRMKDSLSFHRGDWYQVEGKSPLMPYMDHAIAAKYVSGPSNLATFVLSDINSFSSPLENSVGVFGVLDVDISTNPWNSFEQSNALMVPSFELFPGFSKLSIGFQGVYFESDENGGEKTLCLLGDTKLPTRSDDPSNPWPWAKALNSSYSEPPLSPPLSQDDQILLVLRYPITVSFPSVAVRGELTSLNPVTDNKYFDKVHLLSLSSEVDGNYQFGSEKAIRGACDPYPYADSLLDGDIDVYKGSDFCGMLNREILPERTLTIVPNWRCNSSRQHCQQLGPFKLDRAAVEDSNGAFTDAGLLMQKVQCEATALKPNYTEARVFAVFSAARWRSRLGNTTLIAEGKWRSSSGQLCMIGCTLAFDSADNACDSRICIYIPVSLSITQRSLLLGSISSIKGGEAAYFPLSFERKAVDSEFLYGAFPFERHYRYTVLDSLKSDEHSDLPAVVKKTLLKYPKLEEYEDYMTSLDLLTRDLAFFEVLRDTNFSSWQSRNLIQMTVLALGSLLGKRRSRYGIYRNSSRWWNRGNNSHVSRSHYSYTKAASAHQQLPLNVSAMLSFKGNDYTNISSISLEGLYDYRTGKMHLIGCRDMRYLVEAPFDNKTLKAGFDCLIEVTVSYPPTGTQWLAKLGAEISISSKRSGDDPLYFHPMKLETWPIYYRQQRKNILSRRDIEGGVQVLTLSLAVFIILSQLSHIRKASVVDSVPYISLVMLGVQVVGYGILLILDTEASLKKNSESYNSSRYVVSQSLATRTVDFMVKLLVLICFLLTLRLFQRVWESRARLLVRFPNEPSHVPSDKLVLLTTSIIHIMVYMVTIAPSIFSAGDSRTKLSWEALLEEYVGLAQGLFLLPQVLGNFIWNANSQPLRKLYYVGMTMVRVLPRVFDIFCPIPNHYGREEEEFFTHSFDVVISLMALLLAVIIYLQQTHSFLSARSTSRPLSILSVGSKGYERVTTDVAEAELASNVNGQHRSLGKETA